jgi:hypothetical protein
MNWKKLLLIAAIVGAFAFVATPRSEARGHVSIGIGIGVPIGYYGYGYAPYGYYPYGYPAYYNVGYAGYWGPHYYLRSRYGAHPYRWYYGHPYSRHHRRHVYRGVRVR